MLVAAIDYWQVACSGGYAVFSGHGFQRLKHVGPGHQIIDLALWMAGDNAGEDVGEVGVRFDDIERAILFDTNPVRSFNIFCDISRASQIWSQVDLLGERWRQTRD